MSADLTDWVSNMFFCSTDVFLPTPDSLLVNLNECKEVGILFVDMSFGLCNNEL